MVYTGQFGNTCYCNSVLQALYHCAPFRHFVGSYPNRSPVGIPAGPTPEEIASKFHELAIANAKLAASESNSGGGIAQETIYESPEPSTSTPTATASSSSNNAEGEKRSRWGLGMGTRKQSSNVVPSVSPSSQSRTPLRAQANGNPTVTDPSGSTPNTTGNASNVSEDAAAAAAPPLPKLATIAPQDPHLPPVSLLSAMQSLFDYTDASPPHPPPPPKPPQQKPPGSETTGGTTLFNPHNPDRPFVRGGGPHGAGTMGKGVVKPEELVRAVKRENELFRGNMHQDAHEFLGWMLNKVAEDIEEIERSMTPEERTEQEAQLGKLKHVASTGSQSSAPRKTFVHDLFEGLLTNETRCLTCETTSSRDESFLDLSIDISQNSSVTSCLRQFSASEMLCEKNKFFCDTCGGLQEAEKR